MCKEITINEFKEIYDFDIEKFNVDKPTIVEFFAEWCQPCKVIERNINEITKDKDINVVKINSEEEYSLVELFKIRNLPNMLLITPDGEAKQISGILSRLDLENIVENLTVGQLV